MATAIVNASMLELLAWISRDRRTYQETMEAWRTHCPRLSVWEDALAEGYVRIERDGRGGGALVVLSAAGRARLDAFSAG